METNKALLKNEEAADVDVHFYRSMIGSLMYLTASRPDIMFVVCACARFQVTPKTSHLHAVKRIFRYLKGHPKLGFWFEVASKSSNDPPLLRVNTLGSGDDNMKLKELMEFCTKLSIRAFDVVNAGVSKLMLLSLNLLLPVLVYVARHSLTAVRPKSKNDKVRVNTEESAVKPEPELKNTIECNLNPSDGPGKPNRISMKTVKTKWALNHLQQPICVQLTKTVKTLKAQ
ncbi:hypothetical protein Tco_1059109 [Tanacetum coccineum]